MPNRIAINPPHRIYGTPPHATRLAYTLTPGDHVEVQIDQATKVLVDIDDIDEDGDVFVHFGPLSVWLSIGQVRDLAGLCGEAVDAFDSIENDDQGARERIGIAR